MTTEQAEKRVLRWYGSMPAGDFYADVQAYREAIRAETAAHLEEALREAREALTANITTWITLQPLLDTPYEDAPQWTPWTRFGKRAADAAERALQAVRRALSSPGGGE